MRSRVAEELSRLTTVIFLVVAFTLPVFFSTLTPDYFETPKIIFLLVATTLLVVLKGASWVLSGKVLLTRTPIDIPLLLFLAAVLVSAYLSPLRYIAFVGSLPKIHGSASSWIMYA